MDKSNILGGLYGHSVGDALGVPVEFKSRSWLSDNPVTDYMGFMCWNQPPGTFSDDSSMMFCTVESLVNGYTIKDLATRFVDWYKNGYWGAHDELFDIGGTTRRSLDRVAKGENPEYSGEFFPENNGNGSLMRILPLVFFLFEEEDVSKRYSLIKEVSSITHAHFRSVLSCFIFVEYGRGLLNGLGKIESYIAMQKLVNDFATKQGFNKDELKLFNRILESNIANVSLDDLISMGYVLDSLESSLYCFLTTDNYKDSVLKAVNLGGDTDTTAAINGGLAGMFYGEEGIPVSWRKGVVKSKEIGELGNRFCDSLLLRPS